MLGTAFVIGEPAKDTVRLELEAGLVAVALERDGERIIFGRMQQPIPAGGPYQREGELLAALGVERSELPVEAYKNGAAARLRRARERSGGCRAEPDIAALADLPESVPTASRAPAPAGRPGCSRRPTVSTRPGHGLGRRPARRSPRTARSDRASATRSRSGRVSRSGGRRFSTPVPKDRPSGSTHRSGRLGRRRRPRRVPGRVAVDDRELHDNHARS